MELCMIQKLNTFSIDFNSWASILWIQILIEYFLFTKISSFHLGKLLLTRLKNLSVHQDDEKTDNIQ